MWSMSSLKVRNVEIGKGIPKIIAPICDKTEEEILHTARKFSIIPVDFDILDIDIVEWRVDLYDYYNDYKKIDTNFSMMEALVAGVPSPLRSASSGISSEPALSIADKSVSSV